jgi:hypothetical protein
MKERRKEERKKESPGVQDYFKVIILLLDQNRHKYSSTFLHFEA